jgi:hypothetical protein
MHETAGRTVRRTGGIDGNAALTSAAAVALTALLLAEGVTILDMGGLRTPHMFVGLLLIPPVLVKLGSTGYRFFRYYAGDRVYRAKGPPLTPLRLLAPVLVLTTIVVFASGVALLALGHRSDLVLELHKVSFIVWGVVFGVHFLAHLPAMARSLASGRRIPGARVRIAVVALSLAVGAGAATVVLPSITGWHGERHEGRGRDDG